MRNCHPAVYAATALLLSAGVDTSYAQTWTGPYLGGAIGGAMQPNADGKAKAGAPPPSAADAWWTLLQQMQTPPPAPKPEAKPEKKGK